jgi:hypothetical protein
VSSTYSRPPDPGAPPEGESLDFPSGARVPGTDGDGRDDLLLGIYSESQAKGIYLVSGEVKPGTHDPADVGVRVTTPQANVLEWWFPVGDQDRDGADDLSRGRAELYSGRELMAPGPGEDLAQSPSPVRRFEQPWLGLLQLGPDGPPTFVEAVNTGDAAELQVLSDPAICLRTDTIRVPATPTINGLPQSARVSGFMSGSDRIVSLSYSERDSAAVYTWNLGPVLEQAVEPQRHQTGSR